jgi:uncharacterized protein (DUF488 family)
MMILYTIGFTKKSAEAFFTRLQKAGIRHLLDVRLNNTSHLAGFAMREDLEYFLRAICGIEYKHLPVLAPTQDILDAYKKNKGDWSVYEISYQALMLQRQAAQGLDRALFDRGCLLCSEDKPDHCHRRLAAEYLQSQWEGVEIIHL